jgi:heme A synthase
LASGFPGTTALIPQAGLGVIAIIMSIISVLATARLHRQVARQELQIVMLALSLVTYGFQLVIGILLVISSGNHSLVYTVAYLQIALFAVALGRAWALVQGKHLRPSSPPGTSKPADPVPRHSPVHQPDTFQVEIAGTG